MTQRLTRRDFALASVAALAAPALIRAARADEPLRLRCSLDTAPSHLRNVSMKDYLGKVEAASNGKIKTELFESGQLYPDLEVGKALIQGQVEMAAPGSWTITGIVSDADCFQLPALYGQPIELIHKVIDGKAGQYLNTQIQQKLRSHVIGPYLDLGFQNWYSSNKSIASLADLKGMKIRNSGGAGQAWRARFLGAIPNTTAWPNVPLALSQGTFDGLVSSNESLVSAKLWDSGVKYSLQDRQFVAEYIPMTSQVFWDKLSPDLQKMMTDIWAQNVPTYRANMAAAQTKARATLEEHGVKMADPTPEQSAAERKKMMAEQDQLAKDIKVSPETGQADHGGSRQRRLSVTQPSATWPKLTMMLHWWDKIEETLVGLLGLIALVVGLLQVVGRYIDPARAISYAEEVIVYLIIWAIMIVSSQLVRRDGHVRPDLVLRLLSPRWLRIMEIFNCLVAIVFCGALVWYGYQIVDTSLLINETSSTDLQFPMWIYYLALPVGSALMLVRYIMRLVRFVFFFDPATMTVGHMLPR